MKREGYLMERIADPDNLRLAFWKARKGKEDKPEVAEYRSHLDSNLTELRGELLRGDVRVGDYRYFRIYDPKERLICAAAFRERVLHHALMNVCHPVFERFQTDDSYATRIGKGQYAALEKAKIHTRRYRWFCKLDVRKFFDNIDHEVLYIMLRLRFKDPALLGLFRQIIDSYRTAPGRGLPIGNLTSQYFANYYMAYADHHVRERLRIPAYVRYMDDMVLWHNDKEVLLSITRALTSFIKESLGMTLRTPCINSTDKGVPFLGYVLFPGRVRLNRHSKKRFLRKMNSYDVKLDTGEWSQTEYALHVQPLVAFTRFADTQAFRRVVAIKRDAGLQNGQQPRASRRQLEQQRPELPLRVPEQQQSRQREQQQRVPGGVCPLAQDADGFRTM